MSELPGSRSAHKDARRGEGKRPARPRTTLNASAPLKRIMAMAAGGAPLDSAKIVSVGSIDVYFLSLLFKPDMAAFAPVSINC